MAHEGASSSVAVQLSRAEAVVRRRLQPILDEQQLTLDHWRIIAVLDDEPGLGMSDVASLAVVPAATLTRHVDKLVEHGLVLRRIHPEDKRRAVVALSARGQTLAVRLRTAEQAVVLPSDVAAALP